MSILPRLPSFWEFSGTRIVGISIAKKSFNQNNAFVHGIYLGVHGAWIFEKMTSLIGWKSKILPYNF